MADDKDRLKIEGKHKFDSARFQAFLADIKGHLFNQPMELWSFDEVKDALRLHNQLYRGLQDIPIDRIVGSVGRYNDFTREFLPRNPELEERWSRVYAQVHSMEGVPPIDVYQVDDVYFVRDGNHRVSIARQLGFSTIQAYVTEIETPVDLEPDMTQKMWDNAIAYSAFLARTKLDKNRPNPKERILLSEPSRYHGLIEHIELVKHVMELDGNEVEFEHAAVQWFDTIYVPIVTLIRRYNILQYFPDRTEADLYLWLVNNLYHIRQSYAHGDTVSPRKFSTAMLDFLRKHRIPIPDDVKPIDQTGELSALVLDDDDDPEGDN